MRQDKPRNTNNDNNQQALPAISRLRPKSSAKHQRWLLQISSEVVEVWKSVMTTRHPTCADIQLKSLNQDFYVLEGATALSARDLLDTIFPRWVCPVQHQWPTKPTSAEFIEKAAHGLLRKFGADWEYLEILSTSPHLKRVVVGLKGRLLQLKTQEELRTAGTAEKNESKSPLVGFESPRDHPNQNQRNANQTANNCILVVLIDDKGLYAGTSVSRIDLGSALPGGLGFLDRQSIKQKTESNNNNPSRASGKIREVLALLAEIDATSKQFKRWLELGAAPGGMTQHLLEWGADVEAVDLADMSNTVLKNPRVKHRRVHANEITSAANFDALLSDMNGPFINAAEIVARLASTLPPKGLVIFTLKVPELRQMTAALDVVHPMFISSGVDIILAKHLFHNRTEITLMGQRKG